MNYDLTFSKPDGTVLGTIRMSPTAVNIPTELWWLVNRLFPVGLFPYLDPSDTFGKLAGLPSQVHVRGIGPVRVYRSTP